MRAAQVLLQELKHFKPLNKFSIVFKMYESNLFPIPEKKSNFE